ncbi:MAG: hypothetical protein ACR2NR_19015 [Solirubrobacteraceae bacterium]
MLTFFLIPFRINTIYSGLPAHPLFLHVPVMLIPAAVIGAVVLAVWPRLFGRHGFWLGLVAIVALGTLNLTMSAGQQLRHDLHLDGGGPGVAGLVARHSAAAGKLRILTIVFTALLLTAVAVYRTAGPRVTGLGPVDRGLRAIRSGAALGGVLRGLLVIVALASLYFVFHTGDLGAKAVWQGRLGGGHAAREPGGGGGAPNGSPSGGVAPSGG